MNVKDIFALRKQGKIEEAYEAIRPIYKEHKGKFTTLCMFWVASDVFKLRLEQKRVDEAEKIYRALERLLPFVEAYEQAAEHEQTQPEAKKHSAANFMHYAEGRLIKAAIEREESLAGLSSSEREQARAKLKESERFRKRYFAMRDRKKRVDIPSDNPSKENICDIRVICVTDLSAGQTKVLDCIKAHPGLKVPGISDETGIPAKSIERHIKVLIERNLIEHRGSKKTGGYYAL